MSNGSSYTALVKMLLDTSGIQAQIKAVSANQSINIQAKISGGDKLATTMGTLQNQLNAIKIKNADAFKNPEVISMSDNVQGLINRLKTGSSTLGETRVAMGQLRNRVSKVNETFRSTTTSADNFLTTLTKDLAKVAEWTIATTLIIGTIREIKEAIQYVSDLNSEMTKIGMVTGQTTDELSGMSAQFNDMAKELGVDTLTMAQGATEFIRAGKSAADTTLMLKDSTMLAKLGNLEAADATDKLIAVTNAYKISAEDTMGVIDTWVNLDNNFATSTGEIADAMQKSSSMAKLAGVSYQDLASYITVVSSITRQSGDTIGQTFKTIFARMEQVKAGANIDDEGESINNVEKVLLKNGIALRDNANQFRDMSDVLQDVAVKYKELSDSGDTVAQQQVVGAIAGKFRMPERIEIYGQYIHFILDKTTKMWYNEYC